MSKLRESVGTSFDTEDMHINNYDPQKDPDRVPVPGLDGYREKINFHDLIMFTDIFSIPELIMILSQSQLSENDIEYRILSQVAHNDENLLKRK